MMTRPRKNRALRKAGLAYVEGWVRATDAPAVEKMIADAAADVAAITTEPKED